MERPRIQIHPSNFDMILEVSALLLLGLLWVFVALNYSAVPEKIPIHFKITGEIDRFGHRSRLFELPLIATIFYLILTIVNRFPHLFNYMEKITGDNAAKQYKSATTLLRLVKLFVVVIFVIITYTTISFINL